MNFAVDDFALFGLPQRFELDRFELGERRRALQHSVHPDRFAAEGGAALRVATQWAVRINEAHERLKDPLARAGLLCELRGVPLNPRDTAAVPAGFLARQMAWRERLEEEARGTEALRALRGEVAECEGAMLETLRVLLDERNDAQAAAQQARALMFIARLLQDIDRRLDAMEP